MNFIAGVIISLLFFIGIGFVIWGMAFKYKANYLIKECTNESIGILKDINEIEINHSLEKRWYTTKSYVPIYEYEVQGKKYITKGTNGSGFKIGDTITIKYNPNNPEECYIEGYSFILWKILLVIGIVIIIFSLLFRLIFKLVY